MADRIDENTNVVTTELPSFPKAQDKCPLEREEGHLQSSIVDARIQPANEISHETTSEKSLTETLDFAVRDDIKTKIENILAEVKLWSDTEKLLLYLKLPGSNHHDRNKDSNDLHAMPLSTTRAEQTQAFHWIRCHLEECENNSTLPKHEVYDEYKAHCESVNAVRVLSAPDFGKIIKCVFPNVKARRLGTRGNSKYCYSGIQKKRIVKSPQLPNLMAPASADKSLGPSGFSGSSGDKIGDDQTLVAACILVCEWANKLLGRVFGTLTELARFLVGGSYVSSKSMAAFVVMSSNEASGSCNKLTLDSLKFADDQAAITQKRKQTQQHLQRKIQQRQQHKQQQQHQLNLLLHPSTPTGKQFTPILPQTQKTFRITQMNRLRIQAKPQQLQLSPKLNATNILHSPPKPCTPLIYTQTPQRTLGHLPSSTTLSPVTPSLTSPSLHSLSPYHTKSPKRSAPCTPRSATITPSPVSSTPRHTPNGETTRFVFTPITNGTVESKGVVTGGETSPPMLKRPTATHPGQVIVNEWSSHQNKSGISLTNNAVKETPVSPCKQPRMILTNPPTTPNKQKNSFSQPQISPRMQKRSGVNKVCSITPISKNSNAVRLPISPRSPRDHGGTPKQSLARQTSLPSQCSMNFQTGQSPARMVIRTLSHQPLAYQNFSSLDYSNNTTNDCRFTPTNSVISASNQDSSIQHDFLNHIPSEAELEAICNNLTNAAPTALPGNRSHSVPPLPQHVLPRANSVVQLPLTPQTHNRHQLVTQRLTNVSGCVDGLKQHRNRILHGDTNNNGGHGKTLYAAKRNLMTELENVTSSPATWTPMSSGFHQSKQPQPLAEMHGDPLAGLNLEEIAAGGGFDMFADTTADVLFADSNPFGHAWNVAQPLTMDSCM